MMPIKPRKIENSKYQSDEENSLNSSRSCVCAAFQRLKRYPDKRKMQI